MTLPASRQVTYAYDPAGRLDMVTDWAGQWTEFDYDAAGRRTSIDRSNGVASSLDYDAAGEIESIVHMSGANTLQSFAYTYDAAGNRKTLTSPQGDETYAYDALARLTEVTYQGGPTVAYAYDEAGNRTSETRGAQTTNYKYDNAGQLTQVGSETYTHDGAGNLTAAGSDTYGWDHRYRLTSGSRDGHTTTYAYDAVGVKTSSTVDGDTDALLIDRVGGLHAIVDDGEKAYVHAGGLAWQTSGSGTEFALADGLGSVRGLVGTGGSVTGSASFEAFGSPRASSGATSLFGFTGEPMDGTGLIDLRARALDPGIGRFLSIDTVRPNAPGGQGFNLYGYVANNPTTWVDPTGHEVVLSVLFVLAVVIFVALVALAIALYVDRRYESHQDQGIREERGSAGGENQCLDVTDGVVSACPEEPVPGEGTTEGTGEEVAEECIPTDPGDKPGRISYLPNETVVVRGGENTEKRWREGGRCVDANGFPVDLSVQAYPGLPMEVLAEGVSRWGQIGVSTVGEVRAAGGDVIHDPD